MDPEIPVPANDPEPPPSNGEAQAATLEYIRVVQVGITVDGEFRVSLPQDLTGAYGDLMRVIKIIEHRFDLDLVKEKVAISAKAMADLQREAQANQPLVKEVRGGFPGPPKARH